MAGEQNNKQQTPKKKEGGAQKCLMGLALLGEGYVTNERRT